VYHKLVIVGRYSVLVLRYKRPAAREWKVPLNFRIGKTEIPMGLILITITLFALAVINVLTKKTAGRYLLAFYSWHSFSLSGTIKRSSNRRQRSRRNSGSTSSRTFQL
jgi:hypothetical protein